MVALLSKLRLYDLQALTQLHQSETRAEETYKVVILKYPKSVKILRAYVRFLREVKINPWKAQRYDLQADNYEQVSICGSCNTLLGKLVKLSHSLRPRCAPVTLP